jgi:hypothetical protein
MVEPARFCTRILITLTAEYSASFQQEARQQFSLRIMLKTVVSQRRFNLASSITIFCVLAHPSLFLATMMIGRLRFIVAVLEVKGRYCGSLRKTLSKIFTQAYITCYSASWS